MGLLHITPKTEHETPITVEWEGDKFDAVVYLNAIDKRFLKSIKDDENGDEKLIAKVYKSAELSLDGTTQVDINEDTIQDFPLPLLAAMSQAVIDARIAARKK